MALRYAEILRLYGSEALFDFLIGRRIVWGTFLEVPVFAARKVGRRTQDLVEECVERFYTCVSFPSFVPQHISFAS